MEQKNVLVMHEITKQFPGVLALDKVSFDLRPGEVHALLGENGAGKSTLLKVLAGIHKPDGGEIFIHDKKVESLQIQKSGIGVVHQELALAVNMSVAENIFLGNEPNRFGFVDDKKIIADSQKILDKMKLTGIRPEAKVKHLSIAQRQMVEIAKALSKDMEILVLDEPTASLTNKEIETFFELIEELRKNGVSIIYVSHRIEEILQLADRVTVLRDGQHIWTKEIGDTTYHDIIDSMVGRELSEVYPEPNTKRGKRILSVKNLATKNRRVKQLSFELYEGEILGFYGLVGSGRSEGMQAMLGLLEKSAGDVVYMGRPIHIKNPREASKLGIVMAPESRKDQGLVMIQDIDFNVTLPLLDELLKGIRLNKQKNQEIVEGYCEKLAVKTPSYYQKVSKLSGGNQQKVILARWLAKQPKVLILDEPTRGIDIGTKQYLYGLMIELSKEGLAVIFISSELPEIVGVSNRVIVMREGYVNAVLERDDIKQETIISRAI